MTQDGSETTVLAERKTVALPFKDCGPDGNEGSKLALLP